MFILGNSFIGGLNSVSYSPSNVGSVDYIEITNGVYDELLMTKDTEKEINEFYNPIWDFNTVLWTQFNGNTNAGNVDWNTDTVDMLALKVRPLGEYEWSTLLVKDTKTIDDYVIDYNYYMGAKGNQYQFAVVAMLQYSEQTYSIARDINNPNNNYVTQDFEKMFLIENDKVYGTSLTDGNCNTTRNIPSANVELLYHKYPMFVSNTIACYDTGQCVGTFMPINEQGECVSPDFSAEGDIARVRYQKEVMDFITDRKPKILKMPDGRAWLIQITPSPTDNAKGNLYSNREISFSWVEIGDLNNESDLYYLGFSKVTEEFWRRNTWV